MTLPNVVMPSCPVVVDVVKQPFDLEGCETPAACWQPVMSAIQKHKRIASVWERREVALFCPQIAITAWAFLVRDAACDSQVGD